MTLAATEQLLGVEIPLDQAQECARTLVKRYGRHKAALVLGINPDTLGQWKLGRPGHGPGRAMANWLLVACELTEVDVERLLALREPRSSRRKR